MVNWWGILYTIVGLSVAVHFFIRLIDDVPETAAQRAAPGQIVIYKESGPPLRFEFVPRQ